MFDTNYSNKNLNVYRIYTFNTLSYFTFSTGAWEILGYM